MIDERDTQDDFPSWRRRRRGNRGPVESIVIGIAIFLGCGVGWLSLSRPWWLIFPAIFAGILPIIRGVTRLIADRVAAPRSKRELEAERTAENERSVLRIAQARGGLVTPAQVALDTKLSLEDSGLLLESMAKRGHASMEVREDGRLVYRFSEFLLMEKEPPLIM